jgi:hypothetical protein
MIEILYYVGAIWFAFGTVRALLVLSVSHRAYALTVHNIQRDSGDLFSTVELAMYGIVFYVIAPVIAFARWPVELYQIGWAFFRPPTDAEISGELGVR